MNKKHKYSGMLFLEPDDAGGGSGGGGDSAPASATQDPWTTSEEGEGSGPALPQSAASTVPSVKLDPSAFAEIGKTFGAELAKHQQATAQQAPPTPEQMADARRSLKFFDITDDYVKNFDNLDTRKQSLEQFRDGITQHIITVMNHLRGNDKAEFTKLFDERLTPVQSMIEERQNSERQQKFTSRFRQFAAPEVAPHIESAISQLASKEAFKGKSEAESFKLVAELLAASAKAYNPNFILEDAEANGSSHPSRANNSVPVTSPGSGASRSGQPSTSKKGWALAHMK